MARDLAGHRTTPKHWTHQLLRRDLEPFIDQINDGAHLSLAIREGRCLTRSGGQDLRGNDELVGDGALLDVDGARSLFDESCAASIRNDNCGLVALPAGGLLAGGSLQRGGFRLMLLLLTFGHRSRWGCAWD